MEDAKERTLLTYDLSVLILQWLKLPDLIHYGGVCSASRSVLQLHFQRLKRVSPTEFPEDIHSGMLLSLVQQTPRLTCLGLYGNKIIGVITQHFITALPESLCELHLSYLQDPLQTPHSVPPLPRLRVLNLSGSNFEYTFLFMTLCVAPNLEVLRLHGSVYSPEDTVTGDMLLQQLGVSCRKLMTLDLSFSGFVGVWTGVRAFVEHCPNIQELGLTYVMKWRDVSFLFLSFSDPRYALHALSLGDVDADSATFINFASACTTLQCLHLIDCTDSLPVCNAILRMSSLTELNISIASLPKDSVAAILNHCTRLQRLCFLGEPLFQSAQSCTPSTPHLRELSCDLLSLSYLGGSEAFFKAATSLLSLRIMTFDPTFNALVDFPPEQYLSAVAHYRGPYLRALTLAFAPHHLASFLRLLSSFRTLRVLNIPSVRLGTVDVEHILRVCPKLQWLGIWASFFTGDGKALKQLMKEYSFRVVWLKDDGDLSAFDATLYDDYCPQELWAE